MGKLACLASNQEQKHKKRNIFACKTEVILCETAMLFGQTKLVLLIFDDENLHYRGKHS